VSRLLDRVRAAIRVRHFSVRTEEAYIHWVRRYILFSDRRHPAALGPLEIRAFISHLATGRGAAASTQDQALSAPLFLYREVLNLPVDWVEGVEQAKRPRRLPVVSTGEGVRAVLARRGGGEWLMASLLYGPGLRLMECARLRVKDEDQARLQLVVREGKGVRSP
jgi:site-specific recombinase XerD